MRARGVPDYKLGRTVRFRRSVLEQFLEERCLVKAR